MLKREIESCRRIYFTIDTEKGKEQDISLIPFRDGSGYHMDYDLTTDGERNDLTILLEFSKEEDRYIIVLDDLHVL